MNSLIFLIGKTISALSKKFNIGNGSTWPGHIALKVNPDILGDILRKSEAKTVFITGTNGKTTTAKLIQTILERDNKKVLLNSSGANLLNGITSSIISRTKISGKLDIDYAIFEIDENNFPLLVQSIEPDYVIALNLFRDQLDRYGEVNNIARNWEEAYKKIGKKTVFILNADDPMIYFLSRNLRNNVLFFGLSGNETNSFLPEHASDSIFCPKCGNVLSYETINYSHLGKWFCKSCGFKPLKRDLETLNYYPLLGTYNKYNALAAALFAKKIGIPMDDIVNSLKSFKPAFGRQEILYREGKKIQIFLSKNPVSFNESLRTIGEMNPKNLLIVLNDRIPDGTDVSWIWDVDFETLIKSNTKLYLSGDRVYDLALRMEYAKKSQKDKFNIYENLGEAISQALKNTSVNETLYILPTYSAMLETRKILTGKKIL